MPTVTSPLTPNHNVSISSPEQLVQQLGQWSQLQGGTALIQGASGKRLGQLHFQAGRLLWASAEQHRWRRWQRLLTQCCPTLASSAPTSLPTGASLEAGCAELEVIKRWVQQKQMTAKAGALILQQNAREALFDLLQQIHHSPSVVISCRESVLQAQEQAASGNVALGSTEVELFPDLQAVAADAKQAWDAWSHSQLTGCSPNLAPVVQNATALQQRTSPQTYQTLLSLLNGQSTLRELAVLMKQDLQVLAKTLMAYSQWDLIGFNLIPDAAAPFRQAPPAAPSAPSPRPSQATTPPVAPAPTVGPQKEAPLVLCIDDNPKVGEMLGKILTSAGYRYASVQDSLEALTVLLEKKPDFIFLDLVMPVASGYEVCSQIRRVAAFKDTPVVILTGNDGIIDRIRSKASGSTDFISKPLDVQKVLATLRQYLPDRIPTPASA